MQERRQALLSLIEQTFMNIQLGTGIGIYEADAIDDHASEDTRIALRKKEYTKDWREIPDCVMDQYFHSLSFMDHQGLLFSLPAYLHFSLREFDLCSSAAIDAVIYLLNQERDWNFLDIPQKQCIAQCLRFLVLEAEGHIDTFLTSSAYEKYWHHYDLF